MTLSFMSPSDTGPNDALLRCFSNVSAWMSQIFLQLKQDTIEILVVGTKAQRQTLVKKLNSPGLTPSQRA